MSGIPAPDPRPDTLEIELVRGAQQLLRDFSLRLEVQKHPTMLFDVPDLQSDALCIRPFKETA